MQEHKQGVTKVIPYLKDDGKTIKCNTNLNVHINWFILKHDSFETITHILQSSRQ